MSMPRTEEPPDGSSEPARSRVVIWRRADGTRSFMVSLAIGDTNAEVDELVDRAEHVERRLTDHG